MEDEIIIQSFFDRDEAAIRHTQEKYGARLRSLAFGITQNVQTAEECENDAYFEAWSRIPPNDPKGYFFPFLARITRHIAIDRCRERASLKRSGCLVELTEELALCIPAADDVESDIDAKLLGEAISRYLLTLSKEKRMIFVRRYFYLDTVADISGLLAVSESKVKTTLFRLRNGLRDYLLKEGFTP